MTALLIRKMKVEDALAVAEIHTLSWQFAYKSIVDQKFLDAIDVKKREENWKRGIETNHPPAIRLVAEMKGLVVGFACGLENRHTTKMPNCDSELWAIYAHPNHLNKGIGKALLNQFKLEMRSAGRNRLCIWALEANLRARAFYEQQGGILSGAKDVEIGSQSLPEVGYEFLL
jgi:GNAT superfamily N-acetyltransferase